MVYFLLGIHIKVILRLIIACLCVFILVKNLKYIKVQFRTIVRNLFVHKKKFVQSAET